eukprot:SAG11_NODE_4081_length_2074_cov_1.515949_2_plen_189_part_00
MYSSTRNRGRLISPASTLTSDAPTPPTTRSARGRAHRKLCYRPFTHSSRNRRARSLEEVATPKEKKAHNRPRASVQRYCMCLDQISRVCLIISDNRIQKCTEGERTEGKRIRFESDEEEWQLCRSDDKNTMLCYVRSPHAITQSLVVALSDWVLHRPSFVAIQVRSRHPRVHVWLRVCDRPSLWDALP